MERGFVGSLRPADVRKGDGETVLRGSAALT